MRTSTAAEIESVAGNKLVTEAGESLESPKMRNVYCWKVLPSNG